jgi:transcriptional regulator with PAS, ATPase and Fis domain
MSVDRPPDVPTRPVPHIRKDLVLTIRSDARVLITGKTAVGTRALAAVIHRNSRRRDSPFLAINCARRKDLALESRLFGRARASFQGMDRGSRGLLEQAHGGTIFIANIGEIGRGLQARLMRFLQDGEIRRLGADLAHAKADVRVISSADSRLFEQVEAGTFSADLYYRLNVIHLVMPPIVRPRRFPRA